MKLSEKKIIQILKDAERDFRLEPKDELNNYLGLWFRLFLSCVYWRMDWNSNSNNKGEKMRVIILFIGVFFIKSLSAWTGYTFEYGNWVICLGIYALILDIMENSNVWNRLISIGYFCGYYTL